MTSAENVARALQQNRRMRNVGVAVFALFLVAGCASAPSRPPGTAQPQIAVNLLGGSPFFGSGGTAAVTFEVTVGNTGSIPVNVRRIDIATTGMVQYGIYPAERYFNETIPAGEQHAFPISATAYSNSRRVSDVEPLTMRVNVELESGGKRWREIFLSRLVQ
jgi:hypothetical protein